ncbi:membrane-bound PQQ-dependent dehydrogenase, glucose/quinate/shikimate family [Pseudomaricurvus alcaniphilus]|nr:membrane-bound PQQ-dependent dehydrogenase, glucose/quinate/shikimate family [Pseudomaricurvus alcaniphilus]
MRYSTYAIGFISVLLGITMTIGGFQLLRLGGSAYYLLAGVGIMLAGTLVMRRLVEGLWLYIAIFLATCLWAVWEVGFAYWPLFARVTAPLAILFLLLLIAPALAGHRSTEPAIAPRTSLIASLSTLTTLLLFVAGGFLQHGVILASDRDPLTLASASSDGSTISEWRHAGRTAAGTRFVPYTEITIDNVKDLKVAWTLRAGDMQGEGAVYQATPLQIDDSLYTCTPNNKILAIDAESGKLRWQFDPHVEPGLDWRRCRGVSFYQAATSPGAKPKLCDSRIIFGTLDARLMAVDAATGKLCTKFGAQGAIDLTQGMGEVIPGSYMQTTAPTIARNLIIVGGWIADNRSNNEPGGVIRAFHAETGDLVWAWDPGDPNVTRLPIKDGQYTRHTPNVWSLPSVDEELGMIYLPTGNATPDFWGGARRPEDDAISTSVIALNLETGRLIWKFQTLHHDVWDLDVASQPLLFDHPDGQGGKVPALIQLTKQGQIYLLNRQTGVPITEVEERPVPHHSTTGDRLSPTQPYSVGMPSLGTEILTERSMWGLTPLDQLWCRIDFRQLRYEGNFTPPGTDRAMFYPGSAGGANWGSGAIDEQNGYLIVNDIRMPWFAQLITRDDYNKRAAQGGGDHFTGLIETKGAPYAIEYGFIKSPLGMPCKQPPFGTLTAIDLKTHKIAWQRPAGTTEASGPLGIKSHLPMPVGLPTIGGPMATATGLVFYSGTQDPYIRAFSTFDGKELWKAKLPVGSTATPMSYVSSKSGRQFLVVTAGGSVPVGSGVDMPRGDYIIAYSLE